MMQTSNKSLEQADKRSGRRKDPKKESKKDEIGGVLDTSGTCGGGKRELHVWFHTLRYYEV